MAPPAQPGQQVEDPAPPVVPRQLPAAPKLPPPNNTPSSAIAALRAATLPGLPIEGGASLLTQPAAERDELQRALRKVPDALNDPGKDPDAAFGDALRGIAIEFRAMAQGPRTALYGHVADELDTVRRNHFGALLPGAVRLDAPSPEFTEALQHGAQRAMNERESMVRHLAEKHWMFIDPNYSNSDSFGASVPAVPVDGILQFRAGNEIFQVCLYADENRQTYGHVTSGGLIAVNTAACKLSEEGGEARVKKVIANELAHAYLSRVQKFPPGGEFSAAFELPAAPAALDETARTDLGRLRVMMRQHVHETISDYWSTTVDQDLASEAERLTQVALSITLRGDIAPTTPDAPKEHLLKASTATYALSAAVALRALESIDRSGHGKLDLTAELKTLREQSAEIKGVEKTRAELDAKRQQIEKLGSELVEYLGADAVDTVFETLGAPNQEKLLATLSTKVAEKVKAVEGEMLKVVGGKRADLLEFRETVGERLEALDEQLTERRTAHTATLAETSKRIAEKLTPADRTVFRDTFAHYGKFLMSKTSPEAIKLPALPPPPN